MNRKLLNLLSLILLTAVMFVYTGCSKDENPAEPTPDVNESEVLVKHLEASGDVLNTAFPALVAAADVQTAILSSKDWAILDIRSATDFAKGRIKGAVNLVPGELAKYYKDNNLQGKEKVVIACYSGQTAGWATGLLRTLGYSNVFDLKFGMASWNEECASSWKNAVGNGKSADFTTEPIAKPAAGNLPKISTGKTTGAEILAARVDAVLAEGFGATNLSKDKVDMASQFVVTYWSADHYNLMHLKGSYQYTPKADLKLDAALKTLPTDKPVVIYCYTGQTSAHAAAYLRLLGYDARSLSYGVNGMSYDAMPGTKWTDSEIKNYPLEK